MFFNFERVNGTAIIDAERRPSVWCRISLPKGRMCAKYPSLRIRLLRGLIASGVKYLRDSVSAQSAEQPREHDNHT
jgi:hypothetical protein